MENSEIHKKFKAMLPGSLMDIYESLEGREWLIGNALSILRGSLATGERRNEGLANVYRALSFMDAHIANGAIADPEIETIYLTLKEEKAKIISEEVNPLFDQYTELQ